MQLLWRLDIKSINLLSHDSSLWRNSFSVLTATAVSQRTLAAMFLKIVQKTKMESLELINITVKEHLYYAYANLAMAHTAVDRKQVKYDRYNYMIRAKLYKGLLTEKMNVYQSN